MKKTALLALMAIAPMAYAQEDVSFSYQWATNQKNYLFVTTDVKRDFLLPRLDVVGGVAKELSMADTPMPTFGLRYRQELDPFFVEVGGYFLAPQPKDTTFVFGVSFGVRF